MDDLSGPHACPPNGVRAIPAPAEPITPYGGGPLVDLIVDDARAAAMKATAKDHASLTLDERGLCDLELLAVGGFTPLRTFLNRADYQRVVAESRLADGTPWPVPIALPVTPGDGVEVGRPLALRDVYGNLLAFLHVDEIYAGEGDAGAPGPGHYASGRLEVIRVPPHYDFIDLRRTPRELREHVQKLGWTRVVAFPARDPIHRGDEERARRAAEQVGGGLLIQPAIGVPRPGDTDHYARVRCFRALADAASGQDPAVVSLLPLAARPAGPRGAVLHAIVARNYGGTDLLVARDASDEVRAALRAHQAEVGVGLVDPAPMVYLPDADRYAPADAVPAGARTAALSDAEVRDDYLAQGVPLPEWFTRPAVAAILAEAHPPRFRQGLTLWFTGLSGSGKSTVAHALIERLAEFGRNVALLDGDEIRTHLSKGLGFTKEDRDANINRVGYVAGLIARQGGTTICSVVSPYRGPRDNARAASRGNFVEIYCDTPIEACEQRDVKGFYARARAAAAAGQGMGFTGVDDPYEPPENPEVTIDTSRLDVRQCVDAIIAKLVALGYILPDGHRER